jgi:anti-sigma factor RsiW
MTHLDDGALVRFVDGECDAAEAALVREHTDACEQCSARLSELEVRMRLVSQALQRAEPLPRALRKHARTWTYAAAAAVVLLAVAAGVQPVRAWIAQRGQALWHLVVGDGGQDSPGVPAVEPPSASVSFVPATGGFEIVLASRQAAGTLTVQFGEDMTARATIVGDPDSEGLVVLPHGLRIENDRASRASYVLVLPQALSPISVAIGDDPVLELDAARTAQGWTVALSEPAAR